MLFKAINPKVEVNGETVLSIVAGLGSAKNIGLEILKSAGIENPKAGEWYSQQLWLNAFKEIATKYGPATLRMIGKSIPENAQFPPEINSIEAGLQAIDVAYHMNHRIDGIPLFDPKTGKMSEGIGHYKAERIADGEYEIVCDNPYPDDFDQGIINAMALKFSKSSNFVKVHLIISDKNRSNGGNSTKFKVEWKI